MMTASELHRQVCSDVAVTSISRRPRAIVVVLGDDDNTVDHYIELYHSLKCSTLSTTKLEGATAVSREAARLVRVAQLSEMGMANVPIVVHVLGSKGTRLVEELEKHLRNSLMQDEDDDYHVPGGLQRLCQSSCPPSMDGMAKALNTSSRSLLTIETDPMSSDDEDDESTSLDETDSRSTLSDVSPLKAARRRGLQRRTLAESPPPSQQVLRRRPATRSPPSVHRIDMERTGISFSQALNPQEKAFRRDLELFCSHLSIVLWDMPPRERVASPDTKSWARSLYDLTAGFVLCLVYCLSAATRWLLGGIGIGRTTAQRQREIAGMSLARQHALLYCNDKDKTAQSLLKGSNIVMQSKLKGTRQQHGALYVDFIQNMLDRICLPASSRSEDDDDGWSSDEDE